MNKIVLDASALLALLNKEPEFDYVEKILLYAIMSSVNFSEVIAILNQLKMTEKDIRKILVELIYEIVPFDVEQAFIAGTYRMIMKKHGLSFGDRACFALAAHKKLSIVTADSAWSKLDVGLEIIQIR